MEKPLKGKAPVRDELSKFKHDIRNQLSGIQLALDALRYEISDASADTTFYLDSIAESCSNITSLLKDK